MLTYSKVLGSLLLVLVLTATARGETTLKNHFTRGGETTPKNYSSRNWTTTPKNYISRIKIDGNSNDYYFFTPSENWGVTGCAQPVQYIWVKNLNPDVMKSILAAALVAKTSYQMVSFDGICDPANPGYFLATNISVEP